MTFTRDAARETITIIREMVGKRVNSRAAPAANEEDSSESGGYRSKGAEETKLRMTEGGQNEGIFKDNIFEFPDCHGNGSGDVFPCGVCGSRRNRLSRPRRRNLPGKSIPEDLTADLNVSLYSQYIWRGYELSRDSVVIFPTTHRRLQGVCRKSVGRSGHPLWNRERRTRNSNCRKQT